MATAKRIFFDTIYVSDNFHVISICDPGLHFAPLKLHDPCQWRHASSKGWFHESFIFLVQTAVFYFLVIATCNDPISFCVERSSFVSVLRHGTLDASRCYYEYNNTQG